MTSASACAVEQMPNFVARSGTSVVRIVALGSCLASSSIAEALQFGHSPAGIGVPGSTRSQAFLSGPHWSAGPFHPQYWQVAVGIMAWSFRFGLALVGRAAKLPRTEGQSPILMCSPQGGGWHQRPAPSDQSHQTVGKPGSVSG